MSAPLYPLLQQAGSVAGSESIVSEDIAYRTFVRYVMLVARIESEEQATTDILDEMASISEGDGNWNEISKLMWEVNRLFPKLSTKLAFAFLVGWRRTGGEYGPRAYSDGNVQQLLVERLGARTYQGFCFDHADCCSDVELSMACYDGNHS